MEPEEVLEQEVDNELDNNDQVSEQNAPTPLNITTRGNWVDLETLLPEPMVVGKTYHIKVAGHCQFMISVEKPTTGMITNEITYTKDGSNKLWIKTGV